MVRRGAQALAYVGGREGRGRQPPATCWQLPAAAATRRPLPFALPCPPAPSVSGLQGRTCTEQRTQKHGMQGAAGPLPPPSAARGRLHAVPAVEVRAAGVPKRAALVRQHHRAHLAILVPAGRGAWWEGEGIGRWRRRQAGCWHAPHADVMHVHMGCSGGAGAARFTICAARPAPAPPRRAQRQRP